MNWKKVESAERPTELDTESSRVFNYVRKNITEETREQMSGETMIVFVYDELEVPKADWLLFNELSESATRITDVEDAVIELAEMIGG